MNNNSQPIPINNNNNAMEEELSSIYSMSPIEPIDSQQNNNNGNNNRRDNMIEENVQQIVQQNDSDETIQNAQRTDIDNSEDTSRDTYISDYNEIGEQPEERFVHNNNVNMNNNEHERVSEHTQHIYTDDSSAQHLLENLIKEIDEDKRNEENNLHRTKTNPVESTSNDPSLIEMKNFIERFKKSEEFKHSEEENKEEGPLEILLKGDSFDELFTSEAFVQHDVQKEEEKEDEENEQLVEEKSPFKIRKITIKSNKKMITSNGNGMKITDIIDLTNKETKSTRIPNTQRKEIIEITEGRGKKKKVLRNYTLDKFFNKKQKQNQKMVNKRAGETPKDFFEIAKTITPENALSGPKTQLERTEHEPDNKEMDEQPIILNETEVRKLLMNTNEKNEKIKKNDKNKKMKKMHCLTIGNLKKTAHRERFETQDAREVQEAINNRMGINKKKNKSDFDRILENENNKIILIDTTGIYFLPWGSGYLYYYDYSEKCIHSKKLYEFSLGGISWTSRKWKNVKDPKEVVDLSEKDKIIIEIINKHADSALEKRVIFPNKENIRKEILGTFQDEYGPGMFNDNNIRILLETNNITQNEEGIQNLIVNQNMVTNTDFMNTNTDFTNMNFTNTNEQNPEYYFNFNQPVTDSTNIQPMYIQTTDMQELGIQQFGMQEFGNGEQEILQQGLTIPNRENMSQPMIRVGLNDEQDYNGNNDTGHNENDINNVNNTNNVNINENNNGNNTETNTQINPQNSQIRFNFADSQRYNESHSGFL